MGMIKAPMMLATSGNDVDFMVHGLIPLNFFGHRVYITTTHVTTLIVMVFILVLALIARHAVLKGAEKPTGLQNAVEMVIETLEAFCQLYWNNYGFYLFFQYIRIVWVEASDC